MVESYHDRRVHQRVETVQAIFIEVVTPGSRRETQNNIIRCETVDISMQGLKISVDEPIDPGTHLNIAVPQKGWVENLELVGMARWMTDAEGQAGYWVGLELNDTSKENMEKWFKIVTSLKS
jgi:c-di-GMP-binding flagellar brake protein YcgR